MIIKSIQDLEDAAKDFAEKGDEKGAAVADFAIRVAQAFEARHHHLLVLRDYARQLEPLADMLLNETLAREAWDRVRGVLRFLTEGDVGDMRPTLQDGEILVTHWSALVQAWSLGDSLRRKEPGPNGEEWWNYVTMRCQHPQAGPIQVRVERLDGDTAEKKLSRARGLLGTVLDVVQDLPEPLRQQIKQEVGDAPVKV